MKWYGSVDNRLEENKQLCEKIEVGTGMTEYYWSDRVAWEVIAVQDQKHVTVRKYTAKTDSAYSNHWQLISDENNPTMDMAKRGKYWYAVGTLTKEQLDAMDDMDRLNACLAGFEPSVIQEKGKQTKYKRMNCTFGIVLGKNAPKKPVKFGVCGLGCVTNLPLLCN